MQAAAWAVRNKWFGTDTEMTEAAYDVHDVLMAEGVDPASELYYDEIEKRVAAQFPVKMAQHQQRTATGSTKRSNDSARRGRAGASSSRGAGGGGGGAGGSAAPQHQQRGRQSARMRRPKEPAAPSVRAILKSISATTYTPTGWSVVRPRACHALPPLRPFASLPHRPPRATVQSVRCVVLPFLATAGDVSSQRARRPRRRLHALHPARPRLTALGEGARVRRARSAVPRGARWGRRQRCR